MSRFPIASRIHFIVAIAALGLFALAGVTAAGRSTQLTEARAELLRSVVDAALGIATAEDFNARAGRQTEAEAQARALAAIRAMRYLGQEYHWVNDRQPRMVMNPFRPDLDGQDIGGIADPAGYHLFRAFADMATTQPEGRLMPYLWPRWGAAEPVPEPSFVRGFAPWGWVIGTGIYSDDLRAAQREFWLHSLADRHG